MVNELGERTDYYTRIGTTDNREERTSWIIVVFLKRTHTEYFESFQTKPFDGAHTDASISAVSMFSVAAEKMQDFLQQSAHVHAVFLIERKHGRAERLEDSEHYDQRRREL